MTDANAKFREIIRPADKWTPLDPSREVFIPDPDSWFGRNGHIVSRPFQDKGAVSGSVAIPLHAPEQEWQLTLELHYEARVTHELRNLFEAGQLVASALRKHPSPGLAFESRLEAMVQDFVREQGGASHLLPRLGDVRQQLKAEIKKRMVMEFGLDVFLKNVGWRTPAGFITRDAITRDVTFRPSDMARELKAQIQIDLETSGWLAYVYHARYQRLRDTLVETARQRLQNSTFDQVETDLGAIERALRPTLDAIAKREGRKITRFALVYKTEVGNNVPQSVRIKPFRIVFDKGVDYPRAVTVDCEMHLTRQDVGKYVAAGQPKLETWAEATCRVAIEEKLLNVSYVNLFLGHEPGGETGFVRFDRRIALVKDVIRQRAARIGYEVDAITIRTDLDFEELRRGFKIQVTDNKFPMLDPDHEAELDVFVEARIFKEEVIRELFARRTNIKSVVESEVCEVIRSFMRETDPDDYYFYFMEEEYRATAGQGVLTRLEQRIKSVLIGQYKAEEIVVTFTRHQTVAEKRFAELSKGFHEIKIQIARSDLTYTVRYRIELIFRPQWRQFRERMPTLEQVQELTASCLREWLNDQHRDRLVDAMNRETRHVLNDLKTGAFRPVVFQYGLLVQVVTLERDQAIEDEERLKALRDGRTKAIRELDHTHREKLESYDARIQIAQESLEREEKMGNLGEAATLSAYVDNLRRQRDEESRASIYLSAAKPLERDAARGGGREDDGTIAGPDWRLGPAPDQPKKKLTTGKKGGEPRTRQKGQ